MQWSCDRLHAGPRLLCCCCLGFCLLQLPGHDLDPWPRLDLDLDLGLWLRLDPWLRPWLRLDPCPWLRLGLGLRLGLRLGLVQLRGGYVDRSACSSSCFKTIAN